MEELHKLWNHHTAHLKELHQRKEYTDQQNNKNNTKLKIGQPVMVKNHACHTFEPKHLLDYKILKIVNDSTLLLITPNGKERKENSNDVKRGSTTELVENVWDLFLGSIKTKCQDYRYNLRPKP